MNIAQFFNPEWVRADCPELYPRQPRPDVDLPPREPVLHLKDDAPPPQKMVGAVRRILLVLAVAERPLVTAQIAEADGVLTPRQVSSNISHLHARGAVERKRVKVGYSYWITDIGRGEAKEA